MLWCIFVVAVGEGGKERERQKKNFSNIFNFGLKRQSSLNFIKNKILGLILFCH